MSDLSTPEQLAEFIRGAVHSIDEQHSQMTSVYRQATGEHFPNCDCGCFLSLNAEMRATLVGISENIHRECEALEKVASLFDGK